MMRRRERPVLDLSNSQFRESYHMSLTHLIRGSKQIVLYDKDNLKYVKPLGSGASGMVALYYDTVLRKNVAVKTISTRAKSNRDQIFHEEDCFTNANGGQYIVQRLGYYLTDDCIHIVLEYMDEGSLNRHYNKDHPIPDCIIRCIAFQLLEALVELKVAKITHRDIKPDNILLRSDGCVKFSDFGISKVIDPTANSKTYVGTLRYMSPERLRSEAYTNKCDYWSTAIVLLEAALGYYPIQSGITHIDLESEIKENTFHAILSKVNPELASFLSDWLSEERFRLVPELKLKDPYLMVDGKQLTKEMSKKMIAEWLISSKLPIN